MSIIINPPSAAVELDPSIAAFRVPGYWVEVWTRPGAAAFGRVLDDIPFTESSYHTGLGLLGDGTMTIPDTFDRFDDILTVGLTAVGSLIRIYEDSTLALVGEWIPSSLQPVGGKDDPFIVISGRGVYEFLEYAIIEAFDWDGSPEWQGSQVDWIWGGRNALGNFDFSNSSPQIAVYQLFIDASAGTFEITDGTNSTGPIAHNASDGVVEGALESMSPTPVIDDALVTPTDDGFTIDIINPYNVNNLVVDDSALTGSASLSRTQTGALMPDPWTRSQQVNVATPREYGSYVNFRVLEPGDSPTGTYALWINPGQVTSYLSQFAGAQQRVTVTPGGLYQASILVYSVTGGDYRFVIRGLDEDEIARVDVTLPAATPTLVSLPDVVMQTATGYQPSEVIFRFANVEASGTPSDFYIIEGHLDEGMAATTPGAILSALYDDATVNHPGRVVWENEAIPGTPYLTLDFDATNNSAGLPWANSAVSFYAWFRWTMTQAVEALEGQEGIEARIVPDDPDAGTWLLQVYDAGQMDSHPDAAIQGGSQDVQRQLRRFRPNSHFLVEGEARVSGRGQNVGGFGRMETARLERSVTSLTSAALHAANDATNAYIVGTVWSYRLVNTPEPPLVAWVPGDTVFVHDPPEVDGAGRVWEVTLTLAPEQVVWEVDVIPPEVVIE